MTERQIDLSRHQVQALRAVLMTSDEILDEVEEQLPSEDEDATLDLDNEKHVGLTVGVLEGYQEIVDQNLPEGIEYRADFDVIRNLITELQN